MHVTIGRRFPLSVVFFLSHHFGGLNLARQSILDLHRLSAVLIASIQIIKISGESVVIDLFHDGPHTLAYKLSHINAELHAARRHHVLVQFHE